MVGQIVASLSLASGAGFDAPSQAPATPYVTWIQRRAATAFDPATMARSTHQGQYRIDAHVLLPLGFAAPEIWSLQDVGTALFAERDIAMDGGGLLHAWEVLASSKPE